MARLPQPGGDNGNWGTILNDYLRQIHTDNGTLKDDVVGSNQLQDNSVTSNIIAPGAVTKATVGLANVDNTADTAKPVSTAQQTALDLKADTSALATKLNTADLDSQTASKITTNGTATQTALSNAYALRPLPTDITNKGRFDPVRSVYNMRGDSLRIYRAALAKAMTGTGLCEVVWAGSSLAQGFPNPIATQSSTAYLISLLTAAGMPASNGWVWVNNNNSTPERTDARWTKPVGSNWTLPYTGLGFKNPTSRSNGSGNTLLYTSTEVGTIVEWIVTGLSGAYTYSIDGGTEVAVATGGSATATPVPQQVTGLANTTHTLQIKATSGAQVYLAAARVRKATGLLVTNAGYGASMSAEWDLTTDGNDYFALQPASVYGNVPSLILFDACVWINDYIQSSWSPAQTLAALTRIAGQYKARGSDFVLISTIAPSSTLAFSPYAAIPDATYQAFRQAIYDAADAADVPLIDIPDRLGKWPEANARGLVADGLHYLPSGYQAVARPVAGLLTV